MRDGDPNIHALTVYYPEMCKTAIEILGKGKSYAALAAALEISQRTILRWRQTYPEFEEACEIGKDKGQAWWEEDSDVNMANKDYSSVRYIFKMKSQYKIKDGTEPVKQDAPGPQIIFGMEGKEHKALVESIIQNHAPSTNED